MLFSCSLPKSSLNVFYGLAFTLISSICYAQEDNLENTPKTKDDFSWQISLNMSLVYQTSIIKGQEQDEATDYLIIGLPIDLYYKGFFLQSNNRRSIEWQHGSELGYQLITEKDWSLDILLKNYLIGYEPDEIIKDNGETIPELEGLSDRDPAYGLALRYSTFIENDLYTLDIASLDVDNGGSSWLVEGFYSHLIPYRNWDIYFGVGLTYYSSETVNYYVGVSEAEATPARPYYNPSGSFRVQAEIYAQYPIAKKWTFDAGITQSYFDNNFADSPLTKSQSSTQINVGVKYVF